MWHDTVWSSRRQMLTQWRLDTGVTLTSRHHSSSCWVLPNFLKGDKSSMSQTAPDRISLFTRTLSFSNEKWVISDWSNSSQMEYLRCCNWLKVSDGLELLPAVGKTSLPNTGTLTMTEKLRLVMFTSQNGVLCYATSKVIQTGDGSTVLEPPSLSQSREAWPTNRRPRIRPPVL